MNLLVQHEYAKELLGRSYKVRDVELDAIAADAIDEKIYE
jgi:hypothetical protein